MAILDDTPYEQMLAQLDATQIGKYVFVNVPDLPPELDPVAMIKEPEGYTVAVTLDEAQELNLDTSGVYTLFTLGSPGSLEAVGLNSSVAQILSSHSIPCNIFSGVYHTHIFVPEQLTADAKQTLDDISNQARAWLG